MYYMLEQKRNDCFHELGIVVAESIEDAAVKIGAIVISSTKPPESAVSCAELESGYWLTEFEEVTSLPTTSD